MGIFLAVMLLIILVSLAIGKSVFNIGVKRKAENAWESAEYRGNVKPEQRDSFISEYIGANQWPVPSFVSKGVALLMVISLGFGTFNKIFFYAEPGYVYHVRTIAGEERVIDDVGYAYYLFGRINNWKKAMTAQAIEYTDADGDGRPDLIAEGEASGSSTSATMTPLTVVMLDQVDAAISATVRFRIPTDRETFLRMAHEYRTPENLLRTALVPAFKETVQATGSLMAAEEYYSGRRTEFNAEFENQMSNGIYLVTRHQVQVEDPTAIAPASADGSSINRGGNLTTGGTKTKWVVEKKLGRDGLPVRKAQGFTNFGITVVEARVTDLQPNNKFVERMQLKQQAAADRAIAQEKRVQEEEQRLLAIAKGEREVAERQAEAKQEQITQTTQAETTKRLALIEANKMLEQARVEKETAAVQLERDQIKAQSIEVLADADKYERQARIAGDNALQQKLDAEVQIQAEWAKAFASRKVPSQVFVTGGGTGEDGVPMGANGEVATFMNILTMDAAKRLAYERSIDPAPANRK